MRQDVKDYLKDRSVTSIIAILRSSLYYVRQYKLTQEQEDMILILDEELVRVWRMLKRMM